ncbi:hypothetical protein Fot_39056 [Forsythia ovata]|uniref:Uncharacterized protein n=1 Tax=Forsythia ovata TaxID=205694 RepID=A0ABD1S558_9LAMI
MAQNLGRSKCLLNDPLKTHLMYRVPGEAKFHVSYAIPIKTPGPVVLLTGSVPTANVSLTPERTSNVSSSVLLTAEATTGVPPTVLLISKATMGVHPILEV